PQTGQDHLEGWAVRREQGGSDERAGVVGAANTHEEMGGGGGLMCGFALLSLVANAGSSVNIQSSSHQAAEAPTASIRSIFRSTVFTLRNKSGLSPYLCVTPKLPGQKLKLISMYFVNFFRP
ncbi:hypothetical protein BaRGS_00034643, partial [Batillaria attramentaria]